MFWGLSCFGVPTSCCLHNNNNKKKKSVTPPPFHPLLGKLNNLEFSLIKYYARAVWYQEILEIRWWHFDDAKLNYMVSLIHLCRTLRKSCAHFFVWIQIKVAPRAAARNKSFSHLRPPVWASRCFGGCLLFSSHVEMRAARADDTFSRARAAHTALCMQHAPPHHTAHVSICAHAKDFTQRVEMGLGSSGMFCCRLVVWLQLEVSCLPLFFYVLSIQRYRVKYPGECLWIFYNHTDNYIIT